MKAWPLLGIFIVQAILLLAHWFIFQTIVVFSGNLSPAAILALRTALLLLAFSFPFASLLSFRLDNPPITIIYRIAAVWLGFLNFFFQAACLCWLIWFALPALGLHFPADASASRPLIAASLFTLAAVAGTYGLINARWIRIRRISIKHPSLPESWRGRTALVISDLHLGNVNGLAFSRRIANLAGRLHPDVVFLPGDFFDGTKTDPSRLTAPFRSLSPPLGIFFATGNHDEYGDLPGYLEALQSAHIRVLANEMVLVNGMPIIGVPYRDSTHILRLRATLEGLRLVPGQPSILLNHVPNRLPIAEKAGIALQISGHTHGGQLFPFTWVTRRAFGKFTYGLHDFGKLQIYTSSGAGTWGPPMRVGTHPEIVLLSFE